MSVVVSLLRAIDRADGDALVMHVGEKPYVVTAGGHAELAANALTVAAMTGMLDQLLPAESRKALNELGAVEYHLPADQASPGTRYSVVAARGGNDIWIEVRRRKVAEEPVPVAMQQSAVAVEEPPPVPADAPLPAVGDHYTHVVPEDAEPERFEEPESIEESMPPVDLDVQPAYLDAPGPVEEPAPQFELTPQAEEHFYAPDAVREDLDEGPVRFEDLPPGLDFTEEPEPFPSSRFDEPAPSEEAHAPAGPVRAPDDDALAVGERSPEGLRHTDDVARHTDAVAQGFSPARLRRTDDVARHTDTVAQGFSPAPRKDRVEAPRPPAAPVVVRKHADPLHHLLYVAAAHGASALYVAPQAKPSLRVDGEIRVLDDEPLTHEQIETGLRALLQAAEGAPLPTGEIETREVADVGRVQYLGFRDHRGIGAIFRMLPGRAISSEQAGLPAAIQALCTEPEGLLLVAGGRSAGKSTLVAALVDQINRTRRDHVITVESEIQYVHVNRTSFVSQREARDDEGFAEAVRVAMHEAPDVLVIDGAMNAGIAATALQAAADGHLVVVAVTASTTATALERFVALLGPEPDTRALVGEHLRGVITQALLRKTGGGRAAAREVLVNVPSVASLVASAQFDQIPTVLNSGRRIGMVPLNDALLSLVQSRALDVRQAYRKSPDQRELLDMLNRAGFDTTFAERLS